FFLLAMKDYTALSQLNSKDSLGRTPLHIACLKPDLNAVIQLIQSGAEVNPLDHYGNTPLHTVGVGKDDHAIRHVLLNSGANSYAVNAWGKKTLGSIPTNLNPGELSTLISANQYRATRWQNISYLPTINPSNRAFAGFQSRGSSKTSRI